MFRGSFEHTIDGKGRLSIPAKFRECAYSARVRAQLIVTNFVVKDKKCLDVYPFDEWSRIGRRNSQAKKKFDPRHVDVPELLFELRVAM